MSKRRTKTDVLSPEELALMTAYETRTSAAATNSASGELNTQQQAELEDLIALSEQIEAIDLDPVAPAVRSLVMSAAVEAIEGQQATQSSAARWFTAILRPGPLLSVGLLAAILVAVSVRMDLQAGDDFVPAEMDHDPAVAMAEKELESADELQPALATPAAARVEPQPDTRTTLKTYEAVPGSLGPPDAVKAAKEPPTELEKAIKSIETKPKDRGRAVRAGNEAPTARRDLNKAGSKKPRARTAKAIVTRKTGKSKKRQRQSDKSRRYRDAPLLAQLDQAPPKAAEDSEKEAAPALPSKAFSKRSRSKIAPRGSPVQFEAAPVAMEETQVAASKTGAYAGSKSIPKTSKANKTDLAKLRRAIEALWAKGKSKRSRRLLLQLRAASRTQGDKAMEAWANRRLKTLSAKAKATKPAK